MCLEESASIQEDKAVTQVASCLTVWESGPSFVMLFALCSCDGAPPDGGEEKVWGKGKSSSGGGGRPLHDQEVLAEV